MKGAQKSNKSAGPKASELVRQQNLENASSSWRENDAARSRAEAVIYTHVSKWVGREISVGEPIPLPRVKSGFGQLSSTILGGVAEVQSILNASKAIDTPALRTSLSRMEKLQNDIDRMVATLSEFDVWQMARAENAARNLYTTVEGRIVSALGACDAARLGLNVIRVGLTDEIVAIKLEISKRANSGPGRAKDEAAHRVASEAAKLYAKVTGKAPTYSEGAGGLSGQYTPFLRDLYDALGWKRRSLRTGATSAIENLEASDFEPPRIPGLMSILSGRLG